MPAPGVSMEIPFHKPYITSEEISGVVDSLRSGWLTMGPKTVLFEDGFKKYLGVPHAVSMSSCTACLHLALKVTGIKEGDEAIVPAMTFTATAQVLGHLGAKPVFVDVDRRTHNLDVSRIEGCITGRTKAIIPVHYAGQPCDMDEITEIAARHRLRVIEDAAHALPASYKNKKIGTIGDITCFSFYATKTLSTGEGGMATTSDAGWAERMRTLRLHGISTDGWKRYSKEGSWYYEVTDAGWKYNTTDIHAALGLAQLGKLEWMWKCRKEIADKYTAAFKGMDELITPYVKPDRQSAWHLYVLKIKPSALRIDRDRFIREMATRGVAASVHFIPLYKQPCYRANCHCDPSNFKSSEWVYERMLSLPIYPGMMEEEVQGVIDVVEYLVRKFRK